MTKLLPQVFVRQFAAALRFKDDGAAVADMHTKDAPGGMVLKQLDDKGTFEGYASVFGVVDSYGEVVEPGAFRSLSKRGAEWPRMLWHHSPREPIGVWEDLAEDNKGLWAKGRLLLDLRQGNETHVLMLNGAVNGLSVGYRERKVVEPQNAGEPRRLLDLELMEVSVVTFPANRRARINGVKNEALALFAQRIRGGNPPTITEFEELLREAGFPKALAKAIASVGYAKAFRCEAEGSKATDEAAGLAELAAVAALLKKGT